MDELRPLKKFVMPPFEPVIYYLYDDTLLVYIGKTVFLAGRIYSHLKESKKAFTSVEYFECPLAELATVEKALIEKYQPKYNLTHRKAKRERRDGAHLRSVDAEAL